VDRPDNAVKVLVIKVTINYTALSYYFRDLKPIARCAALLRCIGFPARSHEITALNGGGISPPRTAIPLRFAAAAVAGFTLLRNELERSSRPSPVTEPGSSAGFRAGDSPLVRARAAPIEEFEKLSGCPVIINTSFNVRGEPIVCTPRDAYRCFMRTHMDYLVIGDYILSKKEQKTLAKDTNWQKEFELD